MANPLARTPTRLAAIAFQPDAMPVESAIRPTLGREILGRVARLRPASATVGLLAIVSTPLIFLVVTAGDWLLDYGAEDSWIYIKFFSVWANPHPELREMMDLHYKATRLPWIVPGFLAYRIFGPLLGTYVLHLAVLIGGGICFWAGARRLFGDGVGLVAAVLLMAYPGGHGSGIMRFWNYQAQINLTYYLLAMMLVVFGARAHRPMLWYVSAGAALAASLWTSIIYFAVFPAFGVFALAVHGRVDVRRLAQLVVGGLVGAVAATAAFGAANVLVGGPFLFFWRQITFAFEWAEAQSPPAPFWVWFLPWFKGAMWLGIAPITAVTSAVLIVPVLRSDRYRGQRWVIVGCWLTLLVAWAFMILAEMQEKEIVEIAYQYQMILGPAVYSAAALLWVGVRLDRRPLPALGVAALVAGLLLPQTMLDAEVRQQLRQRLDPSQILPILRSEYWSVALLLTIGGVLLALGLRSRRALAIGLAGLVLGVAFAATAIDAAAYLPPERCSYLASQYRVVQRTIIWATDEQIDTGAVVWYDPEERLPRGSGCPAVEMQPIFNAIRQGTTIPPAAQTMPARLADLNPDLVRVAVRNRLSVSLLSTPETADRAAAALQEWAGQAPNPATVRPRKRFEAVDGDVAVVFQAFELRRP